MFLLFFRFIYVDHSQIRNPIDFTNEDSSFRTYYACAPFRISNCVTCLLPATVKKANVFGLFNHFKNLKKTIIYDSQPFSIAKSKGDFPFSSKAFRLALPSIRVRTTLSDPTKAINFI